MSEDTSLKINLAMGATSLIGSLTGIGNYTFNLSKALSKHPMVATDYFYGYSWSNDLEVINAPKMSKLKKFISRNIPHAYHARRKAQQYAFSSGVSANKYNVYHEPNFIPMRFDGATVITIHDLSYVRFPEAHPIERIRMMNKMMPMAVEMAQCIIADSHYTKMEILTEYGVASEKVHVTHLGKSNDFYPRSSLDVMDVVKKHGLVVGRYIIAVGTLEPRKNLIQAIRSYRALPEHVAQRFPLVIVGMRGWKENDLIADLEMLIKQGKAKMLGYVSNYDLPHLYTGARALVFPSVYEGFGLPVLEAMSCGVPVIVSNSSSIPEVVGDAGILVDVGDVDTMKSSIERVCEDDCEYSRLSQLGLDQAELFSWEQCADTTFLAYQYALGQSR